MKEEVLRIQDVIQIKNGVTVLDGLSLRVFKHEIMGILSISERGDSAFLDLLRYNPVLQNGSVYIDEKPVNTRECKNAGANDIHIIDENTKFVEDATVLETIFVLRKGFKKQVISTRKLQAQFRMLTDELKLELEFDGQDVVRDLSQKNRFILALIKAYIMNAKLVVLRNVSDLLSPNNMQGFIAALKNFRETRMGLLYMGRHHEELAGACDRIAVLNKGMIFKVFAAGEYIAGDVPAPYGTYTEGLSRPARSGKPVIEFRDVCTKAIHHMSFSVKGGECVVVQDKSSTAIMSLAEVMRGAEPVLSGEIILHGKPYRKKHARHYLQNGVCFIPQPPFGDSMIFKNLSFMENLLFFTDSKLDRWVVPEKVKSSIMQELESVFGRRTYAKDMDEVDILSQYKLVYYRIKLYRPSIVFIQQPFIGADNALRVKILELIMMLKQEGITVVILVINLSDSLVCADKYYISEKGHILYSLGRNQFASGKASPLHDAQE